MTSITISLRCHLRQAHRIKRLMHLNLSRQQTKNHLIAVIMAADDSKARVRDAITLLNYGFGKCQKYTEKKQKKISPVEVMGGREKQVKVRQQGAFTYVDTTGADLTKIENKTRKDKNVKAPLKKGEKVGETMYYLNGKRIGSIDIITTEEIEKQNYRSALENVLEEYVL